MTGMNEFDSLVARKDAHELDSLASRLLKKLYSVLFKYFWELVEIPFKKHNNS